MTTASITTEQVQAALKIYKAVGDAIRELGEVPSGHLYAHVCGVLRFDEYQTIISQLEDAGLITVDGSHLIRWVG